MFFAFDGLPSRIPALQGLDPSYRTPWSSGGGALGQRDFTQGGQHPRVLMVFDSFLVVSNGFQGFSEVFSPFESNGLLWFRSSSVTVWG